MKHSTSTLTIMMHPIITLPWMMAVISFRFIISIDFKMLVGLESAHPFPALLPLIRHINLQELVISVFGVIFSLNGFLEHVNA